MRKTAKIMLIEDNELDIRMIKHNVMKMKLANDIEVFNDGGSALASLNEREEIQLPDLVLLDLSLPGLSGHEVLETMKADERLRHIIVVILTSSSAPDDIRQAYKQYASAYITKPVDASGFSEIVSAIDGFYYEIVTQAE